MSLYQASFRVRHECPYRTFSEAHPDVTIREWSLSDCQVLELTASADPSTEILEDIRSLGTVLHRSIGTDTLHIVMQSCLCSLEESLVSRFEEYNCLAQPPTIYRQGWEHYTVVAFDEGSVGNLLTDLENDRDIDLLTKTALDERRIPHSMLTPVDRLFDTLTDRQLAALRHALDAGYYEQPRQTSIRELADHTAVSRSTFEEHLRKAENKLVTDAGRFLRLLTSDPAEDPLEVERQQSMGHAAD